MQIETLCHNIGGQTIAIGLLLHAFQAYAVYTQASLYSMKSELTENTVSWQLKLFRQAYGEKAKDDPADGSSGAKSLVDSLPHWKARGSGDISIESTLGDKNFTRIIQTSIPGSTSRRHDCYATEQRSTEVLPNPIWFGEDFHWGWDDVNGISHTETAHWSPSKARMAIHRTQTPRLKQICKGQSKMLSSFFREDLHRFNYPSEAR